MTHKTADCMERPRKVGAKYTGKFIAADEKVEDIKFEGFEASRDRWNGYDPSEYSKIIDRYGQLYLCLKYELAALCLAVLVTGNPASAAEACPCESCVHSAHLPLLQA